VFTDQAVKEFFKPGPAYLLQMDGVKFINGAFYWGRHLWSRGYCVSTVDMDEDKIRKYIRWQEKKDKAIEQSQLKLFEQKKGHLLGQLYKPPPPVVVFDCYCILAVKLL